MAVSDRLRQTLVMTKTVAIQLEQYALDTKNKEASQTYTVLARLTGDVASALDTRLKQIESEEPEYKA